MLTYHISFEGKTVSMTDAIEFTGSISSNDFFKKINTRIFNS